ncbi:ATP-binding protein [Roseospirillum parvum]|uniref:ATP-binding protein n=1 Tax=Roseospirillum parvum TaxID=83401 RepID=UPI000AC58764|nr:ATP-binding protein [Roseospirillum parvum]
MDIIVGLAQAAASLVALTYLQGMVLRNRAQRPLTTQVLSGLLFGGIAVFGMLTPVRLTDGLIFDPRSVVLAISGLFGGPLPAAVATAIAGGYRLGLGPPGDVIGAAVIAASALLGLGYRALHQRGRVALSGRMLLLFGLLVHGVAAALFLLLPGESAAVVARTVTPVFVPTLALATALLGLLMRDITARAETERQAREAAARNALLFETAETAIWTEDQTAFRAALQRLRADGVRDLGRWLAEHPQGARELLSTLRVTRANAAAARLFRAGRADELCGSLERLVLPETLATFTGFILAVWEGRPSFRVETCFRALDGTVIDVVLAVPSPESLGDWSDVPVTLFDIGDRLEAERQVREREALYHSVITSAHDGFWLTDNRGRLLEVNDAYLRMTGYQRGELLGRQPDAVDVLEHPVDTAARITRLKSQGNDLFQSRHRARDGRILDVEIGISYSPIAEGRMFVFIRDITSRKKAEAEILAAKAEAERANQAKSEFLAAMSHDLRTPLNAIMGFAEMMRLETFGPLGAAKYVEYARHISNSGALLVSLVNDVLDLSKIEAGKYELDEEPLALGALMERTRELQMVMAEESGQCISVEVAPDLPPLLGDRRALLQILNNLLSNALKFNQTGGRVRLVARPDPAGGLLLQVADQGIGMTPEGIEKALRPFEQADSAVPRRHDGTGLGLHLCQRLMTLFGGRLEIDSRPGGGTTVSLWFPPARCLGPPAPEHAGPDQGSAGPGGPE